jgi:hypothetical protein
MIGPDASDDATVVTFDCACTGCGQNLRGHEQLADCAHCGTPVVDSLGSEEAILASLQYARPLNGPMPDPPLHLLRFSSPQYLAGLHKGIVLVECGILCKIIVFAASIPLTATLPPSHPANQAASLLSAAVAILTLAGWWRFSAPDPAQQADSGTTARGVLRTSLSVSAGIAAATFVAQQFAANTPSNMAYQQMSFTSLGLLALAGAAVWVINFFATLMYMQGLARRLPDPALEKRARTYMWLLPVLSVFGVCLFYVGPLIAFVLYVCEVEQWRAKLKAIRFEVQAKQSGLALPHATRA